MLRACVGAAMNRTTYLLDRDTPRQLDAVAKLKLQVNFGKVSRGLPEALSCSGRTMTGKGDKCLMHRTVSDECWAEFCTLSMAYIYESTGEFSMFDDPTLVQLPGDGAPGLVLQISVDDTQTKRYARRRQYEIRAYGKQKERAYAKEMTERLRTVAPSVLVMGCGSNTQYKALRRIIGQHHNSNKPGQRCTKIRVGGSTSRKATALANFPTLLEAKADGSKQLHERGMTGPTRGIKRHQRGPGALDSNTSAEAVGSERMSFCDLPAAISKEDQSVIGVLRDIKDWIGLELSLAYQAFGAGKHGELGVDIANLPADETSQVKLFWWCDGHPSSHHDLGRISFWMCGPIFHKGKSRALTLAVWKGDESLGVPLFEALAREFADFGGSIIVPLPQLQGNRTIDSDVPSIRIPFECLPEFMTGDNKFLGLSSGAMTGGANCRMWNQEPGLPIKLSTHTYLYRPGMGWTRVHDRMDTLVQVSELAVASAAKKMEPSVQDLHAQCKHLGIPTSGKYTIKNKETDELVVELTGASKENMMAKIEAYFNHAEHTGAEPRPVAAAIDPDMMETCVKNAYPTVRKEHGTNMFPTFSATKMCYYYLCEYASTDSDLHADDTVPAPTTPASATPAPAAAASAAAAPAAAAPAAAAAIAGVAARTRHADLVDKLLLVESMIGDKLCFRSRVTKADLSQWRADYISGVALMPADKLHDLSKVSYMLSLGHNLKHQNFVFAYQVALRSSNKAVRLSASDRAALDRVFLKTMGTEKHKDFVYAYHRSWLYHNVAATFGKHTCSTIQAIASLIARRNLHFKLRPRQGAASEADLVFGCEHTASGPRRVYTHPGPTEAAEIALLFAMERIIPKSIECLSSTNTDSLFFGTQSTTPMEEQKFRAAGAGRFVGEGDEMHGEESNLHGKDWLRRRGAPLTYQPAAALEATGTAEATTATAMLKSVDLANPRKRKDAVRVDINPLTNTIAEGSCGDDLNRESAPVLNPGEEEEDPEAWSPQVHDDETLEPTDAGVDDGASGGYNQADNTYGSCHQKVAGSKWERDRMNKEFDRHQLARMTLQADGDHCYTGLVFVHRHIGGQISGVGAVGLKVVKKLLYELWLHATPDKVGGHGTKRTCCLGHVYDMKRQRLQHAERGRGELSENRFIPCSRTLSVEWNAPLQCAYTSDDEINILPGLYIVQAGEESYRVLKNASGDISIGTRLPSDSELGRFMLIEVDPVAWNLLWARPDEVEKAVHHGEMRFNQMKCLSVCFADTCPDRTGKCYTCASHAGGHPMRENTRNTFVEEAQLVTKKRWQLKNCSDTLGATDAAILHIACRDAAVPPEKIFNELVSKQGQAWVEDKFGPGKEKQKGRMVGRVEPCLRQVLKSHGNTQPPKSKSDLVTAVRAVLEVGCTLDQACGCTHKVLNDSEVEQEIEQEQAELEKADAELLRQHDAAVAAAKLEEEGRCWAEAAAAEQAAVAAVAEQAAVAAAAVEATRKRKRQTDQASREGRQPGVDREYRPSRRSARRAPLQSRTVCPLGRCVGEMYLITCVCEEKQ